MYDIEVSSFSLHRPNLICRHAAQISNEPQFRKRPDEPLRWIKLPWLYTVTVVMLKLVVIVVIAFAECEKGQEE